MPNGQRKRNPIHDFKISRGHSYLTEYGKMTAKEREEAITSDDFYIDKEFIKDKDLILVDDVYITGAHERRIIKLLREAGFKNTVYFLYYAEYVGPKDPSIEHEINLAAINDLYSIDNIIKNDEFIFNTRVTKFIMSFPPEEFLPFIKYQTNVFRNTLRTNVMGNGYHTQEAFKENFQQLISNI